MVSIKNIPEGSSLPDSEPSRFVIFNADDFGLSPGANAGIVASYEHGVVRSTSVMAGGEAFQEALGYANANPNLDLGLHLTLCENKPVCATEKIPSLVMPDGKLPGSFKAFVGEYVRGKISLREVELELRAQLSKAIDAGICISHLDSHQHLHALPAIFEIVIRLAKENNIPVVRCPDERDARTAFHIANGRVVRTLQCGILSLLSQFGKRRLRRFRVATSDHFFGFMDMGRWNDNSLRTMIKMLRPGLTEICCHPRNETGTEPGSDFREEVAAFTGEGLKLFLKEERVAVTSFREYFKNRELYPDAASL